MTVSESELREFSLRLLESTGADSDSISHTTDGLVEASLRGVDSHGIRLLPHYIKSLNAGRLNKSPEFKIERTAPGTAILNADHALGFPAGVRAVDEALELGKQTGIAAVTVKNSSHGGMLAYYTMRGARNGFFTLASTNTTPRLIPPGARTAFLGTNPISYAFPTNGEEPLCYDSATTMITGNKIKLHRTLDKPLPDGVAADTSGDLTTNPHEAEFLAPFGGYKGFGLALLVDILCGALTGMPNSDQVSAMYGGDPSKKRELGQFFLLVDINRFQEKSIFTQALEQELSRLRSLGREGGDAVLAPGDLELEIATERRAHGIPLEPEVFEDLNQAAKSQGVPALSATI